MTTEEELKSVVEYASLYLDPKYSIDDVSAIVGMQLDALEAVNTPTQLEMYMETGANLKKMKGDFGRRGLNFLESVLKKLLEKVCPWWKKNKEKMGEKLVSSLTAFIQGTNVIPAQFNFIAGIIAMVAVWLIKKGLDSLCNI